MCEDSLDCYLLAYEDDITSSHKYRRLMVVYPL